MKYQKLIVDLQLRAANVYQGYDPAPYGDRKPMGAVSGFKPTFFRRSGVFSSCHMWIHSCFACFSSLKNPTLRSLIMDSAFAHPQKLPLAEVVR